MERGRSGIGLLGARGLLQRRGDRPTSTREEISLFKVDRERLRIEADTLRARLSSYRAVLYQRENAPFTVRDMALRGRALELYPHNSPTPFPVKFSMEPEFEVAEEPPVTAVNRNG